MTEKELMIIFGTETGNAEMLAEDAQRMAPDYGYQALAKRVEFLLNSDFDRHAIGLRGSKRMGEVGGSHSLALIISTHLSQRS